MSSFYDVTSGATTNAADVNQYADRLNATTGAQVKLLSLNNATSALQNILSAAPTADQSVVDTLVSGDAYARVSFYIRSSDGYGGIAAGAGTGAATAHLYAQASGWHMSEALTVAGALAGSSTLAITGSSSLDAGHITTDGAGNLSTVGIKVGGQAGMVLGAGSYAGFHIFIGPTQPTGAVKGDIWIKTPF